MRGSWGVERLRLVGQALNRRGSSCARSRGYSAAERTAPPEVRQTLPRSQVSARRSCPGRVAIRSARASRTAGAERPAGRPAEGAKLTVGAFLEGWLTEVARVTVRPRTYASYRYVVRLHLAPALGDLTLAALSPADVQAFLNAKSTSGCRRGPSDTCGASCAGPSAMRSGPISLP